MKKAIKVYKQTYYETTCPYCNVYTVSSHDRDITKEEMELHIQECEYNPANKYCRICKYSEMIIPGEFTCKKELCEDGGCKSFKLKKVKTGV